MILIESGTPVPDHLKGAVIALGNFDGVHLGHQAVIGEAVRWAREQGRPAGVATFDPHPRRLFVPDAPFFRLTSMPLRAELIAALGVDVMHVVQFRPEVAALTAQQWVEAALQTRMGAVGVVTGEDFTFGKGRSGTIADLARIGAEHGIAARAVGPVLDEGRPVSSTRIREALQAGDCATATRLLTRPYTIRGLVEHGAKLGRSISFPTANIALWHYLRPAYGIYAVRVRLPDGTMRDGAANIGIRPTFDPPVELLEVHLFDFDGDLYGQEIDVELHHYIRPEAKFDGLEALTAAIAADCERAKALLGTA